jgi:hypothetical protein
MKRSANGCFCPMVTEKLLAWTRIPAVTVSYVNDNKGGHMKNYVYRMDHDTGFAPNTERGICALSGCKETTIEKWAGPGSWVIGIGGNNTTRDLRGQIFILDKSSPSLIPSPHGATLTDPVRECRLSCHLPGE